MTWPKINFFASRTSASVIKLRNVLGKIQKTTEKGLTGEILQGLYFDPPNFNWFGQICEAKNFFFWEMTHSFNNFPNCLTYQRMFWNHNPSKKEHIRKVAIFPSKTQFFFSLTKLKNMAILRLSWRGPTNSIKYILQLICVKKDCFYLIQVLEMKFFNFWFISQRSKNWLKK